MKIRVIISLALLMLLSTITTQQKIIISKFNLKEIDIENNLLLKEKDIQKILTPIYNKNLLLLKNREIETILMQNTFIESFYIKKKYPNTLKIKIFEKKPIAVLFNKKDKFYLSEKLDLIEFKYFAIYRNLPYVFGNKDEFQILYNSLIKIKFPFNQIKKYTLLETNRWDLETKDNNIIKLPPKDFIKSLENYLSIRDEKNFTKYNIFDYRIDNQLILK